MPLKVLKVLKDCNIICELHKFHGEKQYYELIEMQKIFKTELIKRSSYNPSKFKELDSFSDDERLLLKWGRTTNQNG